jgi:hypothetical protein
MQIFFFSKTFASYLAHCKKNSKKIVLTERKASTNLCGLFADNENISFFSISSNHFEIFSVQASHTKKSLF